MKKIREVGEMVDEFKNKEKYRKLWAEKLKENSQNNETIGVVNSTYGSPYLLPQDIPEISSNKPTPKVETSGCTFKMICIWGYIIFCIIIGGGFLSALNLNWFGTIFGIIVLIIVSLHNLGKIVLIIEGQKPNHNVKTTGNLKAGTNRQTTDISDLIDIANGSNYDYLLKNGFQRVTNPEVLKREKEIIKEMKAGMLKGSNPKNVDSHLKKVFKDIDEDWLSLAWTEISIASSLHTLEEWKSWDIEYVEYFPAPDGCPQCMALAGQYHIDKCPIPGLDTHPKCRCTFTIGEKSLE
jgi:hypothetical protein